MNFDKLFAEADYNRQLVILHRPAGRRQSNVLSNCFGLPWVKVKQNEIDYST